MIHFIGGPFDGMTLLATDVVSELQFPQSTPNDHLPDSVYRRKDENTFEFVEPPQADPLPARSR